MRAPICYAIEVVPDWRTYISNCDECVAVCTLQLPTATGVDAVALLMHL